MSVARGSKSGFAEVNGVRLYYEVAGEGHPLVLVHADIADSRMWDDQVDFFAQHYQVMRYDYRGFGRSEMPPGPFAWHEDLYALLNYLGVEKAVVIHDAAHMVSMERPGEFNRVVLEFVQRL